MEELIQKLIKEGYLKTPLIIEAFRNIDRKDFVLEEFKDDADVNVPLPIGYGQTISQPLTVAFMLELLQPQPGEKILDIGAGSGWQTALLAHCVGDKGKVIAIELIPELAEFGKKNIVKYNYIEKGVVEFICGDGSRGLEKEAPFDKIIVAAAVYPVRSNDSDGARELSKEWKEQLKIHGRIVAPIENSIWLFIKKSDTKFEEIEYPGFVFVPLINN